MLLLELGRYEEAAQQVALVSSGQPEARVRGMISWCHACLRYEMGDAEQALALYRSATDDLRYVGSTVYEGAALASMGALLAQSDDVAAATHTFDRAASLQTDPWMKAAYEVHRGHLDLAMSRAARATGDTASAARHASEARRRLRDADEVASSSVDVRFAVRMLERALATAGDPEAARLDASSPSPTAAVLQIGAEGKWFRAPSGARVELPRRRQLRRLIMALAKRRIEAPGEPLSVDALLRAVYPDERFAVSTSGAMRIYNGLARLRTLGLRSVLLSRGNGYLLDPAVVAEIES
jgi:hypothetical protein